ncbi:hypothetical protein HDU83_005171 [Entophlyctis luteolus]|nr:hypothetical protein HDU83_005171 [Entophlyctis luteolus]
MRRWGGELGTFVLRVLQVLPIMSQPASSHPSPPGMARTRSKNSSRAGARSADPARDRDRDKDKDKDKDKDAPKKDFKVLRPDTFSQGASLYMRPDPPPDPPKARVSPPTSIPASSRSRSRNAVGPSSRPARPPISTSSASSHSGSKTSRPPLRSAHLLAPVTMQKEIVIVTSRGTFIVKAGPESTIDWALEVASDLMMAANPLGSLDDGTRVVLVAARTGSGLVALEEHLVFDVCKEDKILFAITADETNDIPPSFAHAFVASPVSAEEHARAQRLLGRDSQASALQLADTSTTAPAAVTARSSSTVRTNNAAVTANEGGGVSTNGLSLSRGSAARRKPALEKFRSNIRMSVIMPNNVDDLNAMVSQLEKTEAAAAAKQAEENRRRSELLDIGGSSGPGSEKSHDDGVENIVVSAVTVLNPFGAETEADIVVDGDDSAPNSRRGSTEYLAPSASPNAAEKASRRITRASALSILMDIREQFPFFLFLHPQLRIVVPPMPSFLDSAPRIARGSLGESPSMKPRKTLMVANPDSASESEDDRPPLPSVNSPPAIPKPSAIPPDTRRNSVPQWLAEERAATASTSGPIVSDIVEQVAVTTGSTTSLIPPTISPSIVQIQLASTHTNFQQLPAIHRLHRQNLK